MDRYSYQTAIHNAGQHKVVHQYTTIEALEQIVCNRSLRLTRIDLLNDIVENEKMLDLWKNKVFVSCFTHYEYESYFFWMTYAKGRQDGVMISFDADHLKSLIIHPDKKCEEMHLLHCKNSDSSIAFSPQINAVNWGIYDYSFVDIAYVPRNINLESVEHFQGRIKYVEWEMEKETRIRVSLRPRGIEFAAEGEKIKYLAPASEYIYAKLPDLCWGSVVITLSPFADKNAKDSVERILKNNNLYGTVQVNESILTGEV